MELHRVIEKSYNLKPVIKVEKTENGSGNTYIIRTEQGRFLAKLNERNDFVRIYEKVQYALNQRGMQQSRIIRTNEGMLMTSEGLVLYEFIEGSNYKILNQIQTQNAIEYIGKYNKALSLVPFCYEELDLRNHWDKSRSIDFLTDKFPDCLMELYISNENMKNILEAVGILSTNKRIITGQKKQLIHSDLGADNFIFTGNEVISIIDFTPDYSHELYSLCQFIYWNYLWHNESVNMKVINDYLQCYNSSSKEKYETKILYLLLINAVLYRIAGPLMERNNTGVRDCRGLEERFKILSELLPKTETEINKL